MIELGAVQNASSTDPQVINLGKRDTSKRHSVSERTLDNFTAAGMPVLRLSTRKLLFPVADVDLWIRERFLIARKRPSTLARRPYVPQPNPAQEVNASTKGGLQ